MKLHTQSKDLICQADTVKNDHQLNQQKKDDQLDRHVKS